MNNIEKYLFKGKSFVKKNKGLLTTIGAIIGVGVTIYVTSKATLKVERILNEVHTPNEVKNVKKAVVKEVAKPAATTALTIFCIVLTYKFGKQTEAGLLSALAGAEALRRSYREHVIDSDKFSPEEEQKIFEDSVNDDKYTSAKPLPEKEDYNSYQLYKEELTGEYFWAKPEDVLKAEIHLKDGIAYNEYESFWEWLQALDDVSVHCDGAERIFSDYKIGALNCGWCSVGWGSEEKYGYRFVEILHNKITDKETGREYTLISYPFPPHADYEEVDLCDDRTFDVCRLLKSR